MVVQNKPNRSYPLSAEGEERVEQRSALGVSRLVRQALALMSAGSTHPAVASLGIPLFASRKEGVKMF